MSHELSFRRLEGRLQALVHPFYRRVNKHMRPRGDETVWAASCQHQMVAALRLRPLESTRWLLTGVLVAPELRRQGVALALLRAARQDYQTGNTFLFCEPALINLYTRVGFQPASTLPPELASRLARYQRKTPQLTPMVWSEPHESATV